jgi:ABC-type phosphate/phosphonate transport system substrate-binding protein
MIRRTSLTSCLVAVALALANLPAGAPAQQAQSPPSPVKIGMVGSLFRDVPPAVVKLLTPPFQSFMRDQTGLEGEVISIADCTDLGKRLSDKEVQLGVFHGFEFAWVQQKNPDIKPLVIAINRHRTLKAFLVVRNDSSAGSLVDLKGKAISVPRRSREHSLLYLERELCKLATDERGFFSTVVNHANVEDALDDILRDKVQAALVDGVALESYEQVKSGCFARLKILQASEAFPPAVVAYRQGTLDSATLTKFRNGMITANQSPRGKELMTTWKLTAFEDVPADFPALLNNVLRIYPPPESLASRARQRN